MSAGKLGSRDIIGQFYSTLEQDMGSSWVPAISNFFTSDQASETYRWLGQTSRMKRWIGGRKSNKLREFGYTIENEKYEDTLDVEVVDLERDKTGQVMVRIDEMAIGANSHWASLLSTLVLNGASTLCYDGDYFFDDDHEEFESGVQSNLLTFDVVDPANPTAGEFSDAILSGIEAMLDFKDDRGEPFNDQASRFLVMVPIAYMAVAAAALGSQVIVDAGTSRSNTIITLTSMAGITIELAINSRLSSWTDKFAIFRVDSQTNALIMQEEKGVSMKAQAEGSPLEFEEDLHRYGIDSRRAVGYGMWQRAVQMQLV